MDSFIIDPEFRDKIPPLMEEFSLLKENILSDGAVFSTLIVWDNTILDGNNRYEIIQKHPELVYAVHKMTFANRYEALSWICKNQLGRRNLMPQQKKYLIGQRYEAEKKARGANDGFRGNQHSSVVSAQSGHLVDIKRTRQQIAEDTHTSEGYVQRANYYAKGVDAAEEAFPGIKQEILTGTIKPTETAVAAVAKAEPEDRHQLAAALRTSNTKAGGSRKTPSTKTQYHTPKVSTRKSDMEKIAEISAEMERPKAPAAEESMLRSIEGETDGLQYEVQHHGRKPRKEFSSQDIFWVCC